VDPIRLALHHALRVAWSNRSAFPALARLRPGAPPALITFSVVGDHVQQMTERRWNRTLTLKILSVE
jgi:hypothetical protein